MSANTDILQVAIVTGASSGSGLCIRKRFSNTAIVSSQSRHDQQVEGFKPSVDLILMEGHIGEKKTAMKIVDEAARHFDCIDLPVHPQMPPMLKANG